MLLLLLLSFPFRQRSMLPVSVQGRRTKEINVLSLLENLKFRYID